MPLTLRIVLALLAGTAGLVAIQLIRSPGGAPQENALELACVTLLLAITLLSTVWDRLKTRAPAAGPPGEPPHAAEDGGLEAEVQRILALLRAHGEANRIFVGALEKAREDLAGSLKAEQVRLVISYLVAENDRMRARSAALQSGLEQSQRQIERLKSSLLAVEAQGLSDPLTGLKNRRSLDVVLASQVVAARATGEPLSLVIADIDHFKEINDRHGHPVGDEVLKWFGKVLSGAVRAPGTAARYGGEEFAIVLPQTGLAAAAALAAAIKAELEASPWQNPAAPGTALRVTASFGVAQLAPGEGTSALLARADQRLYAAKAAGRNRVAA